MKTLYRILSLVSIHCLLLGVFGCGAEPAESTVPTTTTVPVETTEPAPDPVLTERRDMAEAYMRSMANWLWRATEDISYTMKHDVESYEDMMERYGDNTIDIKAGRLYRGIPYSYAGAPAGAFMDYVTEVGEDGIPLVSGVTWKHLNGGAADGARVGNDCSGAVQLAWNSIGADIVPASTRYMTLSKGYLPVGEYENDPDENILTKDVCAKNGTEVMFAAYAKLQKADAVVKRLEESGHTMMVTHVEVVYKNDGTIDPMQSYVTFLHQTNRYIQKEKFVYDDTLKENVYTTYGIDTKESFLELYGEGYLPITCKALIDPTPVEEPWVTDSETEHTIDNLFAGTFTSNRLLDTVTITVYDDLDNAVGSIAATNPRKTGQAESTFDMSLFETEEEIMLRGELDLENLDAGSYRCVVVLRNAHGDEYMMREFSFTVS